MPRPPRAVPEPERIEKVCATYQALTEARKAGPWTFGWFVLSRCAAILRMGVIMVSLPRIEVRLGPTGAGQEIARHLSVRHGLRHVNRWAVGVLPISDNVDEYLRGRKRHAVRTHLHHAQEMGLGFRELLDPVATRAEAERILTLHRDEFWDADGLARGVDRGASRVFVVDDGNHVVKALAAVVVDTSWAHLYLCISDRGDTAPAALYLLNIGLVRKLADEGVRYLFVRSALHVTPGQRYLQSQLGFEPMNLHLTRRLSGAA